MLPMTSSQPSGVGCPKHAQEGLPLGAEEQVPRKLSRPTKSIAMEPCWNTRFETDSTSDATSGKIDSSRMTRTAGQMNNHLASASERITPRAEALGVMPLPRVPGLRGPILGDPWVGVSAGR